MANNPPRYDKLLNRQAKFTIGDIKGTRLRVDYVLLKGLCELVECIQSNNGRINDNDSFHTMEGHYSELVDFIRREYPKFDLAPYEAIYDSITSPELEVLHADGGVARIKGVLKLDG